MDKDLMAWVIGSLIHRAHQDPYEDGPACEKSLREIADHLDVPLADEAE